MTWDERSLVLISAGFVAWQSDTRIVPPRASPPKRSPMGLVFFFPRSLYLYKVKRELLDDPSSDDRAPNHQASGAARRRDTPISLPLVLLGAPHLEGTPTPMLWRRRCYTLSRQPVSTRWASTPWLSVRRRPCSGLQAKARTRWVRRRAEIMSRSSSRYEVFKSGSALTATNTVEELQAGLSLAGADGLLAQQTAR